MSGTDQNNNQLWRAKLDALDNAPGQPPLNKTAVWEKLHNRMEPKKSSRKMTWYYSAAAAALLAFFIYQVWPVKEQPAIVTEQQPKDVKQAPQEETATGTESPSLRAQRSREEENGTAAEKSGSRNRNNNSNRTSLPAERVIATAAMSDSKTDSGKSATANAGNTEAKPIIATTSDRELESRNAVSATATTSDSELGSRQPVIASGAKQTKTKIRVVHINEIDKAAAQERMARERYRRAPWHTEPAESATQPVSAYRGFQIRIMPSN